MPVTVQCRAEPGRPSVKLITHRVRAIISLSRVNALAKFSFNDHILLYCGKITGNASVTPKPDITDDSTERFR